MSAASGSRVRAARALAAVSQGASLTSVLPEALNGLTGQDRGFTHELIYGCLRRYHRLDALLAGLLRQPLKPRDRDLHCLLLLGLYQLTVLDTKPYAAVHATVEAARELDKRWAAKLINGVLRNYQRRSEELEARLEQDPAARYSHPAWLLERLQQDWPDDWAAIAAANNQQPPLCLRVNARHSDRAAYLERLAAAGIDARPLPFTSHGVQLETPALVETLPGYAEGDFSVQDGAAQLAAPLLEPASGQRVLDACAAPGGKTAHILECEPQLRELVAVELEAGRLQRVRDNLARLRLQAELVQGDVGRPEDWWNGTPFDRILLDAPCSATGVIRRHPDIKLHRRPGDIDRLTQLQAQLLDAVWPLLRPGGRLLYVTCSVLRAENALQLDAFLARCSSARPVPIQADWGRPDGVGRQLLPDVNPAAAASMDGFYYACLEKVADG